MRLIPLVHKHILNLPLPLVPTLFVFFSPREFPQPIASNHVPHPQGNLVSTRLELKTVHRHRLDLF